MPSSGRIHFSSAFEERPDERQQIRTALEDATGPGSETEPDVPTWVVIRDDIEGKATYVAHHTPSQFTLTAASVEALCRRVDTEMGNDSRYDQPAYRLDGRPDARPDHGPGASAGESSADD